MLYSGSQARPDRLVGGVRSGDRLLSAGAHRRGADLVEDGGRAGPAQFHRPQTDLDGGTPGALLPNDRHRLAEGAARPRRLRQARMTIEEGERYAESFARARPLLDERKWGEALKDAPTLGLEPAAAPSPTHPVAPGH